MALALASFLRVCPVVGFVGFVQLDKVPAYADLSVGSRNYTIGEHHSVVASTFSITPIVSVRSSSFLNFGNSGIGTRLVVIWLNGS